MSTTKPLQHKTLLRLARKTRHVNRSNTIEKEKAGIFADAFDDDDEDGVLEAELTPEQLAENEELERARQEALEEGYDSLALSDDGKDCEQLVPRLEHLPVPREGPHRLPACSARGGALVSAR